MDNIAAPPVFTSNNFFAPLLVSLAGIVSTCIVIFLYHFFLVKYCRGQRQRQQNEMVSREVERCHVAAVGLDPKLLESVPVMTYLSARKCEDFKVVDQRECVVCLGELEDLDMVRLLPNCRHAFHVPCIDRWFVAHSNCPVCRSPLIFRDDSKCDENESHVSEDSPGDLERNCDESHHDQSSSSSSSSCGGQLLQMQSCGLLRHCASLVLPMERRSSQKRLITGLKRSLSMDQSFVIFDMQMEILEDDDDDDQRHYCSSSSSKESRSIRQFDIVSSKLLVSLSSRFRVGRGTQILPY